MASLKFVVIQEMKVRPIYALIPNLILLPKCPLVWTLEHYSGEKLEFDFLTNTNYFYTYVEIGECVRSATKQ